jgi:glycosyltransferase involved in cell wall biosynthesis
MASGKSGSSIWLVLHLSPRKRGSLEEQVLALAKRLGAGGARLTCVFARRPAPWLAAALAAAEVEVRWLDFARPWSAARQLWRWLREARPQLVHFHFVRAHSPLIVAARMSGAQVLVNDHLAPVRGPRSPLKMLFKWGRARLIGHLMVARVAVSKEVAARVVEVEHADPSRVAVIENGIALERFSGGASLRAELGLGTRKVVACVARLSEEKGVETALRMMPLLHEDVILLLCGDGPDAAKCRTLAERLGVAGRVRFLGLRDDVERVLAAADVVVVPTHGEEAFGLAAAEAMAAGRPVVVSRSGAMPALVGNGGLVVEKRDAAGLAAAVTRILDDDDLRQRLGRAARERAHQRFGMDRWLDEVCRLYARACPSLFRPQPPSKPIGRAA